MRLWFTCGSFVPQRYLTCLGYSPSDTCPAIVSKLALFGVGVAAYFGTVSVFGITVEGSNNPT